MKLRLAVMFIVVSQPAMACHYFSQWHYPYPQPRCNAIAHNIAHNIVHVAQTNPSPAPPSIVQEPHDWTVEVTKIPMELTEKELYAREELDANERAKFPELTDEEYEARKKAIEVLKEKMKQK